MALVAAFFKLGVLFVRGEVKLRRSQFLPNSLADHSRKDLRPRRKHVISKLRVSVSLLTKDPTFLNNGLLADRFVERSSVIIIRED
jgi:hypothetical protein